MLSWTYNIFGLTSGKTQFSYSACVFLVVWDCFLARVLEKDLDHGVRSRKSITWCSKGVRERKC